MFYEGNALNKNRNIFISFLKERFSGEKLNETVAKFDIYFSRLVEINSQVNLFSRQADINDLWTLHFMDSLLILETAADLDNKIICDIGTGGGLPGIPLAIIYPNSKIYLLDSKQKKLSAINKICAEIGLTNCRTVHARIEDMRQDYEGFFDVLTCRALKITPDFVTPMKRIMKRGGKMFLYKGMIANDLNAFETKDIYDVTRAEIGKRIIAKIENCN